MRLFFSFFISIIITVAIFFGMQQMISSNNKLQKETKQNPHLVYLRDKKETEIKKKSRIKPKKPPKEIQPKRIKIVQPKMNTKINKNIRIKPLRINHEKIDISSISSLSGAQVELGTELLDANMLIANIRVNPRYPRRAKIRKQEGFVKLKFTINANGSVSKPIIIASKPKGYFEEASLKAIKRWKFKPLDGTKDATITFNFRLAK